MRNRRSGMPASTARKATSSTAVFTGRTRGREFTRCSSSSLMARLLAPHPEDHPRQTAAVTKQMTANARRRASPRSCLHRCGRTTPKIVEILASPTSPRRARRGRDADLAEVPNTMPTISEASKPRGSDQHGLTHVRVPLTFPWDDRQRPIIARRAGVAVGGRRRRRRRPAACSRPWTPLRPGTRSSCSRRADQVGGMAASVEVGASRWTSAVPPPAPPPTVPAGPPPGPARHRPPGAPAHGRIALAGRWLAFPLCARATCCATSRRGWPPRRASTPPPPCAARTPTRSPRWCGSASAPPSPTLLPAPRHQLWGVPPDDLAGARPPAGVGPPGGRHPRPPGARRSAAAANARSSTLAPGSGRSASTGRRRGHAPAPRSASVRRSTGSRSGTTGSSSARVPVRRRRTGLVDLRRCLMVVRWSDPARCRAVLDAGASFTTGPGPRPPGRRPPAGWTEFDAHYVPAADNPVARLSEPKTTATARTRRGRRCCAPRCRPTSATPRGTPRTTPSASRCGRPSAALACPDLAPVAVAVRRLPRGIAALIGSGTRPTSPPSRRGPPHSRGCSPSAAKACSSRQHPPRLAMGAAAATAAPRRHVRRRGVAPGPGGFRTHVVED